LTNHTLAVGIGSITEKPWIVDGEITARQILHLTLSFDHDIVDGADMARFVNSLVKKIENPAFN